MSATYLLFNERLEMLRIIIQQFCLFGIDKDVPDQKLGTYDQTEPDWLPASLSPWKRSIDDIRMKWAELSPLLKQMVAKQNHELLTRSNENKPDWRWVGGALQVIAVIIGLVFG